MKRVAWLGLFLAACSGDAQDDDPGFLGPGALELDTYPALTTSSPLTITGKKEPSTGVLVDGEVKVIQDASTTFSVDLPLEEGLNRIRLAPVAESLAMGEETLIEVTLDSIPPGIREIEPMDMATGVPLTTTVRVVFSEALDCATTTDGIKLQAGTTDVAGTISCDDRTLTFTPSAALAADTDHGVTVEASIEDVAGNELRIPNTWGFRTGN